MPNSSKSRLNLLYGKCCRSESVPAKVSKREQERSQRKIETLVERRRREIDAAIVKSVQDPMYEYYGRSKPIPIKLSKEELAKREKKRQQRVEQRLREIDGEIRTDVVKYCIKAHFGRSKPLERRQSR